MRDLQEFVREWERVWNSHDLDMILSHYSEDVVFRSRKARELVGRGEVRGKADLRAYWGAALARQPDLKFTVQDVFEGHEMMVISYLNHRGVLATEVLYFDAEGQICQAAACHQVG